jgi:hypothetical protein
LFHSWNVNTTLPVLQSSKAIIEQMLICPKKNG